MTQMPALQPGGGLIVTSSYALTRTVRACAAPAASRVSPNAAAARATPAMLVSVRAFMVVLSVFPLIGLISVSSTGRSDR
jgi:hypothetical protein